MRPVPHRSRIVCGALLLGLASLAAARPAAAADSTVNVTITTMKISLPGMANLHLPPGIHIPALDRLTKPQRNLAVSVVSGGTAPDDATATLDVPAGLGVGQTVTLGLLRPGKLGAEVAGAAPRNIQVYWGSGPTVGAGQPKQLDLSGAALQRYLRMARPGQRGSPDSTLAVWPSGQGRMPQMLTENADPTGDYALHTSYAGNASFHIGADQTFLPAVEVTPPQGKPDLTAPITVNWKPVAGALGYQVMAFGADGNPQQDNSKIIMWFASKTIPFDAGKDLMSGDPADGVKAGVLLPPEATSATVPAGIFNGLPFVSLTVTALGPTKLVAGTPSVRVSTSSVAIVTLAGGPGGFGGPRGGGR
ncbi:MAG TPA: hypothetical protein VFJ58_09610 [Armatimonadota bacterium]|nr:hypothetical protein [Armatimonadota bacterium]